MDQLLLDLLASYGPSGAMAVALVYVVHRFETQLDRRDEVDKNERAELVGIIKNNTIAITELSVIIRDRRNSPNERREI